MWSNESSLLLVQGSLSHESDVCGVGGEMLESNASWSIGMTVAFWRRDNSSLVDGRQLFHFWIEQGLKAEIQLVDD
jgi:hypothetical protein